ncbi:DUF357 domain-containing protein [Candidatus Woesearchaeota archaeon]|nr:DUF357 domain-containing protein [Candidatus Woesearchaeota archaeon]
MNAVSEEKLKHYFSLTTEALEKAKASSNKTNLEKEREDFLDMIQRYLSDAHHFAEKGDKVTAFAALNYAHGWLDAGARLKMFDVKDSRLFTVDE